MISPPHCNNALQFVTVSFVSHLAMKSPLTWVALDSTIWLPVLFPIVLHSSGILPVLDVRFSHPPSMQIMTTRTLLFRTALSKPKNKERNGRIFLLSYAHTFC